jgi:hypothetical protein
MKFSKNYTKLNKKSFTTIRKNLGFYKVGQIINIYTPTNQFKAKIFQIDRITKEKITESVALFDADCSRQELINMLEIWYGKNYNDFIIIGLTKEIK